jgi:hypothetical protein
MLAKKKRGRTRGLRAIDAFVVGGTLIGATVAITLQRVCQWVFAARCYQIRIVNDLHERGSSHSSERGPQLGRVADQTRSRTLGGRKWQAHAELRTLPGSGASGTDGAVVKLDKVPGDVETQAYAGFGLSRGGQNEWVEDP